MKVYGIVDLFESNAHTDGESYSEWVRRIMFTNKEDAYKQIINEIKCGEFSGPYIDSIVIKESEMPTLDMLRNGWWHEECWYNVGYELREFFVSEGEKDNETELQSHAENA